MDQAFKSRRAARWRLLMGSAAAMLAVALVVTVIGSAVSRDTASRAAPSPAPSVAAVETNAGEAAARNEIKAPRSRDSVAMSRGHWLSADFTIASYNLYSASLDSEWTSSRKAAASKTIRASGASVVAAQEAGALVAGVPQGQSLAAQLNADLRSPNRWRFVAPARPGWEGILYDSKVLDVVGKVGSKPLQSSIHKTAAPRSSKNAIWATFQHRASGAHFIVLNTHLSARAQVTGDVDAVHKAEAAILIKEILPTLRAAKLPIFVAGDWNEELTGPARAALVASGFLSARAVSDRVVNGALDSYNGFDPAMANRQSGYWVDGIHVSAGDIVVRVSTNFVRPASGGATLPLTTPLASDHNLVSAAVTVTQRCARASGQSRAKTGPVVCPDPAG